MPDTSTAAEALASITGISDLLGGRLRPIGVGAAERAAALPGRIAREIKRYLSESGSGMDDGETPTLDYMAVLGQLAQDAGAIADRARVLIENIADQQLAVAYLAALKQVVVYLQQTIPRRVRHSLSGDENVEPSRMELADFRRVWQIAEDPMIILRDLRAGILIGQQVEALRAMYPALYAKILGLAFAAIIDDKAAGRELPWSRQRGIATLFGVDLMSADLARDMQAAAREAQERKGPGIKTSPNALDEAAESQQLPSQRLQAR